MDTALFKNNMSSYTVYRDNLSEYVSVIISPLRETPTTDNTIVVPHPRMMISRNDGRCTVQGKDKRHTVVVDFNDYRMTCVSPDLTSETFYVI